MKGKIGYKKAGDLGTTHSVLMIVTIFAVVGFIGTAIQPALSVPTVSNNPQPAVDGEEYMPCGCEDATTEGSTKICVKTVFHAVKYMREYVKQALKGKGIYFLWTADAAILIFQGLILGLKDSGFTIQIDSEELKATITFWVSKLVGPQIFFITRFMARLGAISIGISWYLLSFCINTHKIIPP